MPNTDTGVYHKGIDQQMAILVKYATYEGMKALTEQMAALQETKIEHSNKLENHELRILKLEHTK